MRYTFQTIYSGAWLLAAGALLAIGMRGMRSGGGFPLHSRGRLGSSDALLEKTLGQPHLAEPLVQELAKLPPDRPVFILAPKGHPTAGLVAEVVAYLAWPRPVTLLIESIHLNPASLVPLRQDYCALVLCETAVPADFPPARAFGTGLNLVPLLAP